MKLGYWLLLLILAFSCAPAGAVIKRAYPLGQIISDADLILVVTVAGRQRLTRSAVLRSGAVLKGTTGGITYQLRLAGGDNQRELPLLQSRLVGGRSVVLFGKNRRFMLGYAEGAWFRLAEPTRARPDRWQFVHLEPYLLRTYRGSSSELKRIVEEAIAGRQEPPQPDLNTAPGPIAAAQPLRVVKRRRPYTRSRHRPARAYRPTKRRGR